MGHVPEKKQKNKKKQINKQNASDNLAVGYEM